VKTGVVWAFLTKYKAELIGLLIVLTGAFFRLYFLGVSDFQHDEVGAQNFIFDQQNFIGFLLSRSIGAGQFIIAYLANLLFYGSHYVTFFVRLPFAIAGIVSVCLAYAIMRKNFNIASATVSALLFAFSGFFIAFSRLVQYQSFLILICLACVLILFNKFDNLSDRNAVFMGILLGLAGLFHYDAATLIIPLGIFLYLKYGWRKTLFLTVPSAVILGVFYIPYALSPTFSSTLTYVIRERISKKYAFDAIYNSVLLFRIYHSKEFLLFLVFGLVSWLVTRKDKLQLATALILIVSLGARYFGHNYNIIWVLVSAGAFTLFYGSSIYKKVRSNQLGKVDFIELWFGFAFLTYGLLFTKSLSHVYTFLLPLFMLLGILLVNLSRKYVVYRAITLFLFALLLISSVSFDYQAFNSLKPNYPWQVKKYVFGNMAPNQAVIEDVGETLGFGFGFIYNRSLSKLRADMLVLKKQFGVTSYETNEKLRITKYYLPDFKTSGSGKRAYIFIKNSYNIENNRDTYLDKRLVVNTGNYMIYIDN
jgi:hypothetical protein